MRHPCQTGNTCVPEGNSFILGVQTVLPLMLMCFTACFLNNAHAALKESLIPRAVEWFTGELTPERFDDALGADFDEDEFEETFRR